MSSTVFDSSMRKPGTEAPIVIESKVHNIPVKVTILTLYLLNQFRATLLGVLSMKMLPIAANNEPKRQKYDLPTSNSNLSQTPDTMKTAPTTKEILMPCLLSNQLQGKENSG